MSLQRERRRLGRAFHAALLAVGSPAIVIACSSSVAPGGGGADDAGGSPSLDATLARDTSVPLEAAGDALAAPRDVTPAPDVAKVPSVDAGLGTGGCFAGAYELDSGLDANADADSATTDICAYIYACGLAGSGLGAVGCQVFNTLPDGALVAIPQMQCWLPQGQGCDDDAYAPGDGGSVTILCTPCPSGGGRRPVGLRKPRDARGGSALGAYLASMAFEEDAAVAAFERMGAELASLGAPAALVTEAARAAREEARHVRAMQKLARAPGRDGVIARARVKRMPRRSAVAMAAENAAEGCVRETYGALLARWQSIHAEDAELGRAFARIAADEARHAALSWAVAAWIEPQLDEAGRRRVARSRARALRALERAARVEPPRELGQSAGLPAATQASALLEAMSRELGLAPRARCA